MRFVLAAGPSRTVPYGTVLLKSCGPNLYSGLLLYGESDRITKTEEGYIYTVHTVYTARYACVIGTFDVTSY